MTAPLRKSGFSIVEVVVSSLVFSIAALGIFSTIAMIRKPGAVTERRITAAHYGRQILEELRAKVDARLTPWNSTGTTGTLAVGTYNLPAQTIDGVAYTASYVASNGPNGTIKVDLTVTWTEP